MSNWISAIAAVLVLLLAAIGALVLGRLVYMSKENRDYKRELEDAIEKVREKQLQNVRDIGELKARTDANEKSIEGLRRDFWEKVDRVTAFADRAKAEVLNLYNQLDNKLTALMMNKKDNNK